MYPPFAACRRRDFSSACLTGTALRKTTSWQAFPFYVYVGPLNTRIHACPSSLVSDHPPPSPYAIPAPPSCLSLFRAKWPFSWTSFSAILSQDGTCSLMRSRAHATTSLIGTCKSQMTLDVIFTAFCILSSHAYLLSGLIPLAHAFAQGPTPWALVAACFLGNSHHSSHLNLPCVTLVNPYSFLLFAFIIAIRLHPWK